MNDDRTLRDAARRLGAEAADRVDVDRLAAVVVQRLREAPPAAEGGGGGGGGAWIRAAWLRIAAAVVIIAGAGWAVRQVLEPDPQQLAAGAFFVSDDLSDLSAEELRELLTALDDTAFGGTVTAEDNDLTELDAQQLQDVLRSLEG